MNPADMPPADPEEAAGIDPNTDEHGEDKDAEIAKWRTLAQKHEKAWKAKSGDYSLDSIEQLKAKAAKLDELEESKKSEAQKLLERAERAERELQESKIASNIDKAARRHGVPDALVKFIAGSTEEEIDAAAKELADTITASGARGDGLPSKPKPNLTPGGGLSDDEAVDITAIVESIKKQRY